MQSMIEEDIKEKTSISINFLFSLFITLIFGIVNLGYPVFIGLLFGPETIGNYSVLFFWGTLLNVPISNGLAIGISRFIAMEGEDSRLKIEGIGVKVTTYYIFGSLIVYPILGYFVFSLSIIELVIVISLLVNLAFHYLFRKSIQGQEKFKLLLKYELISFAFFIPLMILFGILPNYLNWTSINSNYYYLFIPIIGYHFVFNIWMLISRRKQVNFQSFFKLPTNTKQILFYAFLMTLGSLFTIGMSQVQIIISENYLLEKELGILSFWTSTIMIFSLFTIAVGSLLLPRMTNLSNAPDKQLLYSFVNKANWALTLLFAPLSTMLFVIIAKYPIILDVLTLNKFDMITYWLVFILLAFRVVNEIIMEPTVSFILTSEKRIKYYPFASFIHSISVILTWIFLIPNLDANYRIIGFVAGLAIGSILLSFMNLIYVLIITKKKIGSNIIAMFVNTILGAGAIILLQYWSSIVIVILSAIYALSALSYGIFLLIKMLKDRRYMFDHTNPIKLINETND